jgi:uncharacterized protein (TIGR02996 family)
VSLDITEQFLLQDIRKKPDDNALRLIYADWLEDNDAGDGKRLRLAEIIRTQISLNNHKSGKTILTDDQYWHLVYRERELDQRWEWTAPLCKTLHVPTDNGMEFDRGLINITLWRRYDSDNFRSTLNSAAKLLATAPIAKLHLVVERDHLGNAEARALAKSPYLRNFTGLSLNDNHIGNAGVIALATSQNLCNLTMLNLTGNCFEAAGRQALLKSLRSGPLENVTELLLDTNDRVHPDMQDFTQAVQANRQRTEARDLVP